MFTEEIPMKLVERYGRWFIRENPVRKEIIMDNRNEIKLARNQIERPVIIMCDV